VETVSTVIPSSSTGFALSGSSQSHLRHSCFLLVLVAGLLFSATARAQQEPTDSQVKAAYLYNFGKFVRWQNARTSNPETFELCVLGKDPFGKVLESTVEGDSIDGRKIVIKRMLRIQEASSCSILFVSLSEENRLSPILAVAQHSGMLTVSDIRNFAQRGGIIGFVVQGGRIRFEVNRRAAEQSHLLLSSELLKVARLVIDSDTAQH